MHLRGGRSGSILVGMNARDIFDKLLPKKLSENPALFAGLDLAGQSVRLQLDGPQGGDWTLDFGSGGSAQVKAVGSSSAHTHIQMSDDAFAKLLDGKLNVPMALITRKIKVSGDKGLAMKVGEALRTALV